MLLKRYFQDRKKTVTLERTTSAGYVDEFEMEITSGVVQITPGCALEVNGKRYRVTGIR